MNVRLTIVLILVLVIIGGLVAVTQVLRDSSDDGPERKARLYRIDSGDLVEIGLSQEQQSIVFVAVSSPDGNREWFIEEESGENAPVNIQKWGGIPILVGGPSVIRDLSEDEEALDLATYGLEAPRRHIYLTLKSGARIDVEVGDDTPTGEGYYVKVANTQPLYIVTKEWIDVIMGLLAEPPYQTDDTETG